MAVVEDRSIDSDNCEFDHCCELVTPVLEKYDDLYQILSEISYKGGFVNDTCGVHIHIDKPSNSELFRLMREFFNIQDEVESLFEIPSCRVEKYCKKFPKEYIEGFLSRFNEDSYIEDILKYSYGLGTFCSQLNVVFNNVIPKSTGCSNVGQFIMNSGNVNKMAQKYQVFFEMFGVKIEAKKGINLTGI